MDLSPEDKSSIEEALANHGAKAREQRNIMKLAIKQWGGNLAMSGDKLLEFEEAVERLPNTVDEDFIGFQLSSMTLTDTNIAQEVITTNDVTQNVVQLLCVDYSGIFLLPSYGLSRPGADYYASNLNLYSLVITDLSMATNYVYVYDERGMGKDCDALCSLRFGHHLEQAQSFRQR